MNPAVPNFSMIRERADKAEGGVCDQEFVTTIRHR